MRLTTVDRKFMLRQGKKGRVDIRYFMKAMTAACVRQSTQLFQRLDDYI